MALHKTIKQRNNELAKSGKQLKNYGVFLRIYPTDEQQILIAKTIGCARRTFNDFLQARQDHYHEYGNALSVSA